MAVQMCGFAGIRNYFRGEPIGRAESGEALEWVRMRSLGEMIKGEGDRVVD